MSDTATVLDPLHAPLPGSQVLFVKEDPLDDTMIELLTQLAVRKWLIVKATACSVIIGLILCFAIPTRYMAVTKIMPPKQTQSTTSFLNSQTGFGTLAEAAGGSMLTDPNAIFIGLLKSRPIADSIIAKYGLMDVYGAKDMTGARMKLSARTKIASDPSTLISISVYDRDRGRAAAIANTYTEQLRLLSNSISVSEASRRRTYFESQLIKQKEILIAAELSFEQIQQSKGLLHLDAQSNVIIGSLAAIRGQIAAKEVELQALRTYATERNPEVQLAESELSTMQREANHMRGDHQPDEYSDFGLKEVPKAGLDFVRAQRELQYQQSFFDLLLRQYEAAKLDESKEAATIQIVEPAVEPDRRSSPARLMILLLSIVTGLFLGCLLAVLLHRLELELVDPEGAVALGRLRRALTH